MTVKAVVQATCLFVGNGEVTGGPEDFVNFIGAAPKEGPEVTADSETLETQVVPIPTKP